MDRSLGSLEVMIAASHAAGPGPTPGLRSFTFAWNELLKFWKVAGRCGDETTKRRSPETNDVGPGRVDDNVEVQVALTGG